MADQTLNVTPEVVQNLLTLRSEPKFGEEDFYPGAPSEEVRQKAETAVNAMLGRLATGLAKMPRKSYVLSEFQEMLRAFEDEDSEEREQACAYCERVMDILKIESSDGLLNTWLYGLDPEAHGL